MRRTALAVGLALAAALAAGPGAGLAQEEGETDAHPRAGFWFNGGLGAGNVEAEISGGGSGSETGGAALLGLGYDFRLSDGVSLTPFLNGVGISWDGGDVNFNQLGLSITTH